MKAFMLSTSPLSLMRGMEQFILSGTLPSIKTVQWLDADISCTNGTVIKLPKPFMGMSEADLGLWRYKCQHEIGHEMEANNKPHWKDIMTAHRDAFPSPLFWSIANLLSDFVQEKNQLGEWYGRDGIILHGRELFMEHMLMPKLDTTDLMGQLFLHDALKRMVWNPYLPSYADKHNAGMQSKIEKCGEWNRLRNEHDVFELTQEIFKLFPEQDPEDDEGEGGKGEGEGIADKVVSSHLDQDKRVEEALEEDAPRPTIQDDGSRVNVSMARRIAVRKSVSIKF